MDNTVIDNMNRLEELTRKMIKFFTEIPKSARSNPEKLKTYDDCIEELKKHDDYDEYQGLTELLKKDGHGVHVTTSLGIVCVFNDLDGL